MKKNKNVLFLCPEYPYPANTGGKVAHCNHIDALTKIGYTVTPVFFDVDGLVKSDEVSSTGAIFKRTIPKARGVKGMLLYLYGLFFTLWPRILKLRRVPKLLDYVEDQINTGKYDMVFFDHLSSFAFFKTSKKFNGVKYVYLAQNIEVKIFIEQCKQAKSLFKKAALYIDYLKISYFESKVINFADLIVTISSHDFTELSKTYTSKKFINIPELIALKNHTWEYNGSKNIVFIGGTSYYANYDAVEWLINTLMPQLLNVDPAIKAVIIGDSRTFIGKEKIAAESVNFAGRVSDEELNSLCLNSSLFISPVILGSGIKVKILEAASIAIPILSTKESLLGNDFLSKDLFEFDRNDVEKTVKQVFQIINNKELQIEMSENIKSSLNHACSDNLHNWELIDA